MSEDVICPFCSEPGFDLLGLKLHLTNGHCVIFENLSEDEERKAFLARFPAPPPQPTTPRYEH